MTSADACPAALQRIHGDKPELALPRLAGPGALKEYLKDPGSHPAWPKFCDGLLKGGLELSRIESVWTLILEGIQLHQRHESLGQKDEGLARSTEKNVMFKTVAERVRDMLTIQNQTMALWSGGVELTDYAKSAGFAPLEKTPFGLALESIENELFVRWKPIGTLWDYLARNFVQGADREVHVFMRAHVGSSSLLNVEIPLIAQVNKIRGRGNKTRVKWHSLFFPDKGEIRRPCEINNKGELVDDFSFDEENQAAQMLERYRSAHAPALGAEFVPFHRAITS